jgi:polysaccharide biosynthesis protein PslH
MLTPVSIEMTPKTPSTTGKHVATRQLKVTYLTSHLPYPIDRGGTIATAGFIEAIAKCASVSVLVLTSAPYAAELIQAAENYYNQFCRSFVVHPVANLSPKKSRLLKAWHYLSGYPRHGFWSAEAEAALIAHIKKTGCEILWCNSTFEAKYLAAAKRMRCRTVVATQNVESDLRRQQANTESGKSRWAACARWLDVRRLEKRAAKWADVVTAITDADLQHYRRLKPANRTFLLPFGYRNRDILVAAAGDETDQEAVCFVGSMDWPPNVTAAQFLVREIMPLVWETKPNTKCFLIGKNPGDEIKALSSNRVIVTGSVPSLSDYYRHVPVVVVPMRSGSGIKVKLIEALAAGSAVVTTSAGAAGLTVESGRQLMVVDDPAEFAKAVTYLLTNRSERAKLGTEAQRFVRESLSPIETERQVEKILECLRAL